MGEDQNCIDYRGQNIVFTENVRRHILQRHPEMDTYIAEVCNVLAAPDLVYSLQRTKTHWYYKFGVCRGLEAGTFMLVIVGYNDAGAHRVKTAYPILSPAVTSADYLVYVTGQQL